MIGELGTLLVVSQEYSNDVDFLPNTRYFNEQIPNRNQVILIPGIVPTVERTFFSEIDFLKTKRNIIGIDYPEEGFDIPRFENTLCCAIGFNTNVSVIASSFGARVITEILLNNPQLASKINALVLFGPFMYLDKKSSLSVLGSLRSKVPIQSLGLAEEPLVRYARSRFNYDPCYYNDLQDKNRMINEMAIKGLGARMRYFAKKPNIFSDSRIATPTTIVWWQKEPACELQKRKIEDVYPNLNTVQLKSGAHGFLQSEAKRVNEILGNFISSNYI